MFYKHAEKTWEKTINSPHIVHLCILGVHCSSLSISPFERSGSDGLKARALHDRNCRLTEKIILRSTEKYVSLFFKQLFVYPVEMTSTEFNIKRLEYLLVLYGMSKDELLSKLNEDRKKLISLNDISGPEIKISLLKKIDEIFGKGLAFYLDFSDIEAYSSSKVFFRKNCFHSPLKIEDKRIVDSFESLKSLLDGYRILTDSENKIYPFKGSASVNDLPKDVANKLRSTLLPEKDIPDHRNFLKAMIGRLAEINLYVFEFIEAWNKREKATISGFYLNPNVIVIKRQKSFKREIFTLAHEIGHYLLGIEEIENLDMSQIDSKRASSNVEKWCNDFAFYLIAGDNVNKLYRFDGCSEDMNELIDHLSATTHISRMAWYTKLAYEKRVPIPYYLTVINNLKEEYEEKQREIKEQRQQKKSRASTPKPIISPLYLETMQYAFYNGLVTEASFCEHLKINYNKIDKYL